MNTLMKLESKIDTLMQLLQGGDDRHTGKVTVKKEEQEFVVRFLNQYWSGCTCTK